jgi:hypothetical protein
MDSTIEKHQYYSYFLIPVDYVGNTGIPGDTASVHAFFEGDTPYLKKFKVYNTGKNRQLKVTWDFEQKPFIRSLIIERSREFDRDYKKIVEVSPFDTSYLDYVETAHENYYYRLIWMGPDSMSIPSVVASGIYIGEEVPEPPDDVVGYPVEEGVLLNWEDDQRGALGYFVFRSSRSVDSLIQISDQIPFDSSRKFQYLDSSSLIFGDQFYQYSIKTVNDNYLLSGFSDTIVIRPGKKTIVRTPFGLKGRKHELSVYLSWQDQSLVDRNLLGYKLFRRRSDQQSYQPIHEDLLSAKTNHFQDKDIEKGKGYVYKLKAYDMFGSESGYSDSLFVIFPLAKPLPPPAIQALNANEGITIRWGEVAQSNLAGYNIYRYSEGKSPEKIKQLKNTFSNYTDPDTEVGERYFYFMRCVNVQGIEGPPSNTIVVKKN